MKKAGKLILLCLYFLTFLDSALVFSQAAGQSDFLSLCQESSSSLEQKNQCQKINNIFFQKTTRQDYAPFELSKIGAHHLSVDKQVHFLAFQDPNNLTALAYCYFVFRGWVKVESFSPDQFSSTVTGFSLLDEQISEYEHWLGQTADGKACQKKVEKDTEVKMYKFNDFLKTKRGVIALNLYALIKSKGIDNAKVMMEAKAVINHERIHAYQATCPPFELWGKEQWQGMSQSLKKDFALKYPQYNWSDPSIAAREYVAYSLENNFEAVQASTKNCPY